LSQTCKKNMSYGRPEPEVIANFADGHSYSKGKMEEIFRSGVFDKPPSKPKEVLHMKRDDLDLIVHELEITRAEAEKALANTNGDIAKALALLIEP